MHGVFQKLLAGLNLNPGVNPAEVSAFHTATGLKLPNDYTDFLKAGNGGEGVIGSASYAILWKLQELQELNAEYEVSEYAPCLFLFGSDGGGEAFAFDMRTSPWSVVQVPFVGMDTELAEPMGDSFLAFLQRLHEAE
jgi:hypothetical protein